MAIEIDSIDHIVLRTSNLEQMLGFYTKVLNCPVERETAPETGLVQLRAGSALIDLVAVDSELGRIGGAAPTKTENNLDHFCLRVRMIGESELKQHLLSHGVEVGDFASRYGAEGQGLSIYIKDPDGNTVELRSQL